MNFVSVIVPCYNEEKNIGFLLEALNNQNYPKELFEIIIIDGESSDQTLVEISKNKSKFDTLDIIVVTNPQKNIPSAVNIGIRKSKGEIIVRMDAHSIPDINYIKFCVENLNKGFAANVGGRWIIIPGSTTYMANCIALAASHPFGVGDAKYRYSDTPGFVDTVPYGSFYRSLFDDIGFFDEDLLANEDYEFNVRIRNTGKKIYFDPKIQTKYIARANLKGLMKQYWRYGFWKLRMLKKYPRTLRWRQAIPPLFVAGIILLTLMSIFVPLARIMLIFLLFLYFCFLFIGSLSLLKYKSRLIYFMGVPIAIFTMHFSWGLGFLYSSISGLGKKA
jgi:glycosyltransferase involved in cell wall biosynthesis